MGYKNGQIGYRTSLLENRSVIKKNNFAIITQDGLVNNSVPGFENCNMSILGTPALGASFVDYIIEVLPGGGNRLGFGGQGIETFIYVIKGNLEVSDGAEFHQLTDGGYIYLPSESVLYFENKSDEIVEVFLYKRRYEPFGDLKPYKVVGNSNDIQPINYEDMHDVQLWDLLPKELAFDMNMHILKFSPGASHGYVETHYQEHGAYLLSGKGMYNLDNEWYPVQKGDYIFMSRYSLQAAYSTDRSEPLVYIYSKDANRDPKI